MGIFSAVPESRRGAALASARKRLGVKQEVAAMELGWPVAYISEIENGHRLGERLERYAAYLEPLVLASMKPPELVWVSARHEYRVPLDSQMRPDKFDSEWAGYHLGLHGRRELKVPREVAEEMERRGSHRIMSESDQVVSAMIG